MRFTYEEPELLALVHRWVMPGRRYLRLGGGLLRLTGSERTAFTSELGEAAAEIAPRELAALLDCGWRERRTAAWLIAISGRTEFRERLGELLTASEVCCTGQAYCIALCTFGTPADAGLLVSYLDRYLRRPDLHYDQAPALGALLHLDARLGTDRASPFLAPDGLWRQWLDGPPRKTGCEDVEDYRRTVAGLCAVVDEAAAYCSADRRTAGPPSGP
ncbi:DUF6000 family protein [Streptomyces meridianus]|uniref:DUF6000 family protein n=1 Tax=Streptomyces meridianus TaxID=2938945 RepID=A0ABT0XDQ3_9ACTN|nr:DUF6000 family protein [Streptomyces meridianus]MCM2580053.1 DUF6000 family protein [Streptomyces meridianus]